MLLGSAQMAITSLHFAWELKADLLSLTCRSPRSLAHHGKGNMSKTPEGVRAAFFNELQQHCLCDPCVAPRRRLGAMFCSPQPTGGGLAARASRGLVESWEKLLSHQSKDSPSAAASDEF